jgi:hypothetical protein
VQSESFFYVPLEKIVINEGPVRIFSSGNNCENIHAGTFL